MTHPLDAFFKATGVAIIGASGQPNKAGHQILRNMIDAGYPGAVYPVNPREREVAGLPCYPALAAVPGPVDLVIIAAPSTMAEQVVDDLDRRCRERGDVRAVITAAAGFAETGTTEGIRRQELLMECCRRHGLREMGPNCVGIIDNRNRLDTTFILGAGRHLGGISFVSQSGALGAWLVMNWSSQPRPVGFNKFISLGNSADVDVIEVLEYLGQDPDTRAIGLYLEGHKEPRRLMELLRSIIPRKPVVVLKVGKTEAGGAAAHSHTGSLAGSDRLYDGVLQQIGAIRVHSIEELSDTLVAFDRLPPPAGNHVFVITQAGGPGIYCVDTLAEGGQTEWARISDAARAELRRLLPPFASVCHPEGHVDLTAAANATQHARAAEIVLREAGVDAVILITVPVLFMPPLELADKLTEVFEHRPVKPFLPVILSGDWVRSGRAWLEAAGIPTFETPDRAARALTNLMTYQQFLAGKGGYCGHALERS